MATRRRGAPFHGGHCQPNWQQSCFGSRRKLGTSCRGELSSNHTEDHELSMLSLHLLQNCMVYVNTLMLQQILSRPHWVEHLTARDRQALTPLFWEYVNPYGRQELDMQTRIAALA